MNIAGIQPVAPVFGPAVQAFAAQSALAPDTTEVDAPQPADATQAAAPTAPAPDATGQLAKGQIASPPSEATQEAASTQGGLAPLLADFMQAANMPGLPPDIGAAIHQLLALRLSVHSAPASESIKAALQGTSLLAQTATPLIFQSDIKSGLLMIQQVLQAWLGESGKPAADDTEDAPPPASSDVPPPFRGGPTSAQPAVASTLPDDADALTVGAQLLSSSKAAIAHQDLLQLASSPASPHATAKTPDPQWMFEIPLATPQGSSVAQFAITRDTKASTPAAPVWRARFSVDIEPLGPVHAGLALMGNQAWVSLWAKRDSSMALLQAQAPALVDAFDAADVKAEVVFHSGVPASPVVPAAGQFLNRAA